MSGLLGSIEGPQDVKRLDADELPQLAGEIRDLLVDACARFGGHLGPNLGVVELTIAVHRVFDSPADPIVWDTGHQAYVHKLLTGRADGFGALKQEGESNRGRHSQSTEPSMPISATVCWSPIAA